MQSFFFIMVVVRCAYYEWVNTLHGFFIGLRSGASSENCMHVLYDFRYRLRDELEMIDWRYCVWEKRGAERRPSYLKAKAVSVVFLHRSSETDLRKDAIHSLEILILLLAVAVGFYYFGRLRGWLDARTPTFPAERPSNSTELSTTPTAKEASANEDDDGEPIAALSAETSKDSENDHSDINIASSIGSEAEAKKPSSSDIDTYVRKIKEMEAKIWTLERDRAWIYASTKRDYHRRTLRHTQIINRQVATIDALKLNYQYIERALQRARARAAKDQGIDTKKLQVFRENESLQKRVEEQQQQLNTLREEAKATRSPSISALKCQQEAEKLCKGLQQKLDETLLEHHKRTSETDEQEKALREQLDRVHQELKATGKFSARRGAELDDLKREHERTKSEATAELAKLQDQLERSYSSNSALRQQLEDAEKARLLQATQNALNDSTDTARNDNDSESVMSIDDHQCDHSQCNNIIAQANADLMNANSVCRRRLIEYNNSIKQNNDLKAQLSAKELEQEKKIAVAVQEEKGRNRMVNPLQGALEEKHRRLTSATAERDRMRNLSDILMSQKTEVEKKFREEKEKCEAAEAERNELKEANADLKRLHDQVDVLQKALQSARDVANMKTPNNGATSHKSSEPKRRGRDEDDDSEESAPKRDRFTVEGEGSEDKDATPAPRVVNTSKPPNSNPLKGRDSSGVREVIHKRWFGNPGNSGTATLPKILKEWRGEGMVKGVPTVKGIENAFRCILLQSTAAVMVPQHLEADGLMIYAHQLVQLLEHPAMKVDSEIDVADIDYILYAAKEILKIAEKAGADLKNCAGAHWYSS